MVWHVILGLMVASVPLGLAVRAVRVRRQERAISPGLRQLLDPPGLRYSGPRVCPDHPVHRRTQRQILDEMWE